jgi:hypothetical protein
MSGTRCGVCLAAKCDAFGINHVRLFATDANYTIAHDARQCADSRRNVCRAAKDLGFGFTVLVGRSDPHAAHISVPNLNALHGAVPELFDNPGVTPWDAPALPCPA